MARLLICFPKTHSLVVLACSFCENKLTRGVSTFHEEISIYCYEIETIMQRGAAQTAPHHIE